MKTNKQLKWRASLLFVLCSKDFWFVVVCIGESITTACLHSNTANRQTRKKPIFYVPHTENETHAGGGCSSFVLDGQWCMLKRIGWGKSPPLNFVHFLFKRGKWNYLCLCISSLRLNKLQHIFCLQSSITYALPLSLDSFNFSIRKSKNWKSKREFFQSNV